MALPKANNLIDLVNKDILTAYNSEVKSTYIKGITSVLNNLTFVRGDGSTVNVPISSDGANIHSGTTKFWDDQNMLIGEKSHIYIYEDYAVYDGKNIPNIKIGDGNAYLIDSPFITTSLEDLINTHINDTESHVSKEDRDFWNNKVSCQLSEADSETIIFSNN